MTTYTSFDSLLSGSRSRPGSREETPETHHTDSEELDSKATQLAQDKISPDSQYTAFTSFGIGGSGSGVSDNEETSPMQTHEVTQLSHQSEMVSFGFGRSRSGVSDEEETSPMQTQEISQQKVDSKSLESRAKESQLSTLQRGSVISDDGTTDLPESDELVQHKPAPKLQDSQKQKLQSGMTSLTHGSIDEEDEYLETPHKHTMVSFGHGGSHGSDMKEPGDGHVYHSPYDRFSSFGRYGGRGSDEMQSHKSGVTSFDEIGSVSTVTKKSLIPSSQSLFEEDEMEAPGLREVKAKSLPELAKKMGLKYAGDLGGGNYSTVGKYSDGYGREYALKLIESRHYDPSDTALSKKKEMFLGSIPESGSIERGEALALAIPSHPNVLQTHGLILYNPDTGGFRYATRLSPQEVMGKEVVAGTITEIVPDSEDLGMTLYKKQTQTKVPGMSSQKVKSLGYQIGSGIAAIHKAGYCHRDIKPSNVLVDSAQKNAKIIDFGFMKNMTRKKRASTLCGDNMYKAPEIHTADSYDQKVDAWSFGIVLYNMAFGGFPSFADENELQTMRNAIQFAALGKPIEATDSRIPQVSRTELGKNRKFWDLLNKLLCSEDKRITVAQALQHPFFTS